jgi:hypothetical protein
MYSPELCGIIDDDVDGVQKAAASSLLDANAMLIKRGIQAYPIIFSTEYHFLRFSMDTIEQRRHIRSIIVLLGSHRTNRQSSLVDSTMVDGQTFTSSHLTYPQPLSTKI